MLPAHLLGLHRASHLTLSDLLRAVLPAAFPPLSPWQSSRATPNGVPETLLLPLARLLLQASTPRSTISGVSGRSSPLRANQREAMAALAAAGSGGEAAGAARLAGDLSDARLIEQQVRGTWDGWVEVRWDGVNCGEVGSGGLGGSGLGWGGIEVGAPVQLRRSRTV